MAAGTDGQIITYDASGNPVAVGPGTDGQVLTSTGAGSPPAFESIDALPAVGSSGNVLTSNGSAWASAAPAAGGKCLQAVHVLNNTASTASTQFPADDSIPQNNEGVELMTLAITPQSASSKLHIHVQLCGSKSNEAPIYWALFVDSTANALAWGGHYTTNLGIQNAGSGFHVVNSSSTSARTYKIRIGTDNNSGGTVYINRNSASASRLGNIGHCGIIIYEIGA